MLTKALSRTLQMTLASGEVRDVVVRIGIPEPDPLPGGDFRCLVEIGGLDEPYSRHFHAIDEIEAFLAGCWMASQLLPTLTARGAKLT